jgi:hypothetical protein
LLNSGVPAAVLGEAVLAEAVLGEAATEADAVLSIAEGLVEELALEVALWLAF